MVRGSSGSHAHSLILSINKKHLAFIIQQSAVYINLRGLVLGGMLIGALGVLDERYSNCAARTRDGNRSM